MNQALVSFLGAEMRLQLLQDCGITIRKISVFQVRTDRSSTLQALRDERSELLRLDRVERVDLEAQAISQPLDGAHK